MLKTPIAIAIIMRLLKHILSMRHNSNSIEIFFAFHLFLFLFVHSVGIFPGAYVFFFQEIIA